MKTKRAFTLTELLVVIALLSLLAVTALPAMGRAKYKTKTARCASNMRLWGAATSMYLSDNKDNLPYFGADSGNPETKNWVDWLAPYVARTAEAGQWFTAGSGAFSVFSSEAFTNDVRKCPAGNSTSGYGSLGWDTWIGANFGYYGYTPLSGPFYYGNFNPPLSITRIRKPADALAFMETVTYWVYSPVQSTAQFDYDYDGDGAMDSNYASSSGVIPYNYARPKVHENGANVTLLDGHVERVPYKLLWNVTASGTVKHSFWHLED